MRSVSQSRRAAGLLARPADPRSPGDRAVSRRARPVGKVHGESIWPFFVAGGVFALLIAIAGPAAGADPLAPRDTQTAQAPSVPAGGLDLSFDAGPLVDAPPATDGRFERPTAVETQLAPNLHLRGLYQLHLTLYPDDQRPEEF
jgi:hypothetical protein